MAEPPKALKRPPTSGTRRGNGQEHGAGRGGPARGEQPRGDIAEPFAPGAAPEGARAENDSPEEQAFRLARRIEKRQRADLYRGLLLNIALDTSQPAAARVSAIKAGLERDEGMPVQVNVNVGEIRNLSDEELSAIAVGKEVTEAQ
jgi:hypothetical protein